MSESGAWGYSECASLPHHPSPRNEPNAGLAALAAERALTSAGVAGSEIDLVIVATSSPDDLFGDATSVAAAVGATGAVAYDLTAACSGFLFATVTASQFLHTGAYQKAIVVGADALSRCVEMVAQFECSPSPASEKRFLPPLASSLPPSLSLCFSFP